MIPPTSTHMKKSEIAIREALVKRYPRERFLLATKMPLFVLKNKADQETVFNGNNWKTAE